MAVCRSSLVIRGSPRGPRAVGRSQRPEAAPIVLERPETFGFLICADRNWCAKNSQMSGSGNDALVHGSFSFLVTNLFKDWSE